MIYGFVVDTVGHKHMQEKGKYSSYQKSPTKKKYGQRSITLYRKINPTLDKSTVCLNFNESTYVRISGGISNLSMLKRDDI